MHNLEPQGAQTATILLVDDDPVMRELASAKLTAGGHAVRTAENGAEGLALLEEGGADLVISDLDMPVMTGFALTRAIRGHRLLHDTPVIVITASDHADAVDEAFSAGATSFLAKPINWTLFGQAVLFVLKASQQQQALRVARDQAEAGARFKDGLMSVMSHELRTPLNAIIGFGQLLGEQFERENDHLHREYADYIVDGGKRLLSSISDMLLASDARTGLIAINETDCTVGEVIDLACAPVEKAAALAEMRLKVVVEDSAMEICCDRTLMSRAVSKLLDNAVKFSPRGSKILVAATGAANGVAILVEDEGPGISPEVLACLTQPFAQSDMSLKRSKEGLGLGLPLAQAIAAAHDAAFRIESPPGGGVRAMILLPASRVIARGQAAERRA